MPTIRRFEDLEVWKMAKDFTVRIYETLDSKSFLKDRGLRDQIRRASVSIMANIAEGFDRNTNKEFINFLHYSLSSTSEVKSHLYLAVELGYISEHNSKELLNTLDELTKKLKTFIGYLRSTVKSKS